MRPHIPVIGLAEASLPTTASLSLEDTRAVLSEIGSRWIWYSSVHGSCLCFMPLVLPTEGPLPDSGIESKVKESCLCENPKQYTVAGKLTSSLLSSVFTCTLILMEIPSHASIIAEFALQGSLGFSFWHQAKKGIYSGLRVTLFQEKIVNGYCSMNLLNFLAEKILAKKSSL